MPGPSRPRPLGSLAAERSATAVPKAGPPAQPMNEATLSTVRVAQPHGRLQANPEERGWSFVNESPAARPDASGRWTIREARSPAGRILRRFAAALPLAPAGVRCASVALRGCGVRPTTKDAVCVPECDPGGSRGRDESAAVPPDGGRRNGVIRSESPRGRSAARGKGSAGPSLPRRRFRGPMWVPGVPESKSGRRRGSSCTGLVLAL